MAATTGLNDVFADLEVRFLSHLPSTEFKSERLFFHLEQAWWLYEDDLSDRQKHLPHFKFEDFAREFFNRSAILSPFRAQFDVMYTTFKEYQHRIPVYGCALLTSDLQKVLLVTGFRSQNSWGFPKGKINQSEDELACALREVYEETGFDASYLNPKKEDKMMWSQKNGKTIKIFIVPGVPEEFPFAPRVVKEIDEIKWWKVSDLPAPDKPGRMPNVAPGVPTKNKFWGVSAFVPQLRRWIAKKQNLAVSPMDEAGLDIEEEEELDAGEFSVEEMFKVNKILRQKELAAAHVGMSKAVVANNKAVGNAKSPSTANKKAKAQQQQHLNKPQQPLAVTAIAKNMQRHPQGLQARNNDDSSVFAIDLVRLSKAMQAYLA